MKFLPMDKLLHLLAEFGAAIAAFASEGTKNWMHEKGPV